MSTPDTAGLDKTVNLDRCSSHRQSHCQFENGVCILRSPAKHTCNNTTYRCRLQHWQLINFTSVTWLLSHTSSH